MKLRKLIVAGFKSFADRTEFVFDDGISCIVGPNGCGKSNVVDAVKWVLGEQSAKSLRGSAMMDVIFNGSSARKPAGVAEVTLVFDNEDGLLQPAGGDGDKTEPMVSVTRRLYRSGQSEYLINKAPARLRDIREMFMDTGVGVDAYGVIEQGKVTGFLQASQDERRAIFDEAAGISKYKARKREAIRKLARVEQNLLRINDILQEVEKRLRSIKYQAGKARNYQSYTERLKELRSLHFLAQYHQLQTRRHGLEAQLDTETDDLSQVNTRIGQLEAARSSVEVETVDLERTNRDLDSQIASVSGQITSAEQRVEMLTGRIEELGEQSVAAARRCEELEAKIDAARSDLTARRAEVDQLAAESAELAERYESLREAYTQAQHAINKAQAELDDAQADRLELMRQSSQVNNRLHSLSVKQENLQSQQGRLDQRGKQVDEAISSAERLEGELTGEHDQAVAGVADAQQRLDQARQDAEQLADKENRLRTELSDLREKRSATLSRITALNEMQQRLEGVAGGVRKVLQARQKGRLGFLRGILGELIDSDVEHAPIVEAALAGADQQLIADRLADVQDNLAELDEVLGKNGQAEVLCLDRSGASTAEPPGAPDAPQIRGRVVDWVRCEDALRPAVTALLGRTLLVDTLADAADAASACPGPWRFVTTDGRVLEADGRVRFGATGRGAGVITRRSELAQLETQRQELEGAIESLTQRCADAHEQIEANQARQQNLRNDVYEANSRRVELESRLRQIGEELEKRRREKPLIARELQDLAEQLEQARGEHAAAQDQADRLEKASAESQDRIAACERAVADARRGAEDKANEVTEVKVALAQAEQRKLAASEAAGQLERQIEQMSSDLQAGRETIAADRQRRDEASQAIATAREQIETLYARQQELSGEAEEVAESRRGLKERAEKIRAQLAEQRKAHDSQGEKVNATRGELGQVDVRIENVITRASDEMQMQLVDLYRDYEHDDERDWQAVAEGIEELRGKINRLGNVNLDAITEQEELEQREAFLTGQLKDIEESQKQLTDLIKRINVESRELFLATFTAVRENFQHLFRKLFGGGKADVHLLDPEDVLESGIEIVARPPGKELRSLSLLSGGEKTMTALALLFSIFRSRPSPFCLLDEVDAALDEANIERFATLVTEFVDLSQFVIISHAKRTMAAGNVLYGVTMQEPGVSKRISVRFEDVDAKLDKQPEPVGV